MKNLLAAKNITLAIADKILCRDLNLEIRAGDVWGILGPNGCGKTTLLHALARLHSVKQGDIFLHDKKISAFSGKELSRRLGILFQDTQESFSQTVQEYCLTGRHPHLSHFAWENTDDKKIAAQALKQMELENKLTQQIHTLSGGERRRLSLATVLTQTPSVYLLDEPTNHLDIYHQIKVLNYFKTLAETQAIGVMMSLHDVNMAQRYCNKVLMLFDNGETLQGTPLDVFTTENFSRLYQHSFRKGIVENISCWLP